MNVCSKQTIGELLRHSTLHNDWQPADGAGGKARASHWDSSSGEHDCVFTELLVQELLSLIHGRFHNLVLCWLHEKVLPYLILNRLLIRINMTAKVKWFWAITQFKCVLSNFLGIIHPHIGQKSYWVNRILSQTVPYLYSQHRALQ